MEVKLSQKGALNLEDGAVTSVYLEIHNNNNDNKITSKCFFPLRQGFSKLIFLTFHRYGISWNRKSF